MFNWKKNKIYDAKTTLYLFIVNYYRKLFSWIIVV